MSQEISSPLQNIIARMAKAPVNGEVAKIKARMASASGAIVVLCDVSGSMSDFIGNAGMSKYDHLKIALRDVVVGFPKVVLVAFASRPKRINTAAELPDPLSGKLGGGTDLAGALRFISPFKPSKTIVISDGLPDYADAALAAAESITGEIDCIYCGPDQHPAVYFLQKLARATGGTQVTWDGYKQVSSLIRGLLPAPGGA